MLDFSNQDGIKVYYCPGHTASYNECFTNRKIQIMKYYDQSQKTAKKGQWECEAHGDASMTQIKNSLEVCK